jgi:hypothetical protein
MSGIQATIFRGDTRRSGDGATVLPVSKAMKSRRLDFRAEPTATFLGQFGDQFCAVRLDGEKLYTNARALMSRFATEKIPALFLLQGNELHRVFADSVYNTNLDIQTQMTNRED